MLKNTYPDQTCSIARALEVVGERWTLLILRDAVLGSTRFDQFQESLGVATNVLSARLERLVAEGLLERRPYQQRPERHEYVLTDKGRALAPALITLMKWGDRYYPTPSGPPRLTLHDDCGGRVDERLQCDRCHQRVDFGDLDVIAGPGLGAPA